MSEDDGRPVVFMRPWPLHWAVANLVIVWTLVPLVVLALSVDLGTEIAIPIFGIAIALMFVSFVGRPDHLSAIQEKWKVRSDVLSLLQTLPASITLITLLATTGFYP